MTAVTIKAQKDTKKRTQTAQETIKRKMKAQSASAKRRKDHYVYILRCADDTLYTGWTTDLGKRLQAHNAGRGAKYTRGRIPAEMVYHRAFATKEEALKEEARIKRLSRKRKEALIAGTA